MPKSRPTYPLEFRREAGHAAQGAADTEAASAPRLAKPTAQGAAAVSGSGCKSLM